MGFWTIFWIVIAVLAVVLVGLYFWGRKLETKYDEQQKIIKQIMIDLDIDIKDFPVKSYVNKK